MSEASVATRTLTDYVAGARDLSYVCQLSPQANCSTRMRNGCWVSNVWNLFCRKENLAKKIWPGGVSILRPSAWKTNAFTTEPLGLWQLWSSNWVLILFSTAVTVTVSIQRLHEGHLEKATETQALPGTLIALFYISWLATHGHFYKSWGKCYISELHVNCHFQ